MVKHLLTMRETWVQSLGWEDLLEKEMATHSSILAWKIPWTEETGGLQPMGSEKSDATVTNTFQKTWTKISKILYYSTISRKNLS